MLVGEAGWGPQPHQSLHTKAHAALDHAHTRV